MSDILYIIRGLPGSGKSTFARSLNLSHHYEADMWFDKFMDGGFDPSKLGEAHGWCQQSADKAMAEGKEDVVVSNTFTQHWEMQPYKDMASKHGYQVKVLKAVGTWESIHGVPESAITTMRGRWEDDASEEIISS
jgi:predicted kinase